MVNDRSVVKIDTSPTIKNLLIRAGQFMVAGEPSRAAEYYNKVLDIDATCADANNGIRRIKGLPVDENVFFVMAKSADYPLAIYIDGEKIGELIHHNVLFIKVNDGEHVIKGVAFRNEQVDLKIQMANNTRLVLVADYGMRGATLKFGTEQDLPREMR